MVSGSQFHTPVLLSESLEFLLSNKNGIYVDGTVGGGGHARQLLSQLDTRGRLIGIDADEEAIQASQVQLQNFGDRVVLNVGNFGSLGAILSGLGIPHIDGLLLDLGVSSHQLDEPARGFSFQTEGRLDLRMNTRSHLDASEIVREFDERSLSDLFWRYGEERMSRRIAKAIVRARDRQPLTTTFALREAVAAVVGPRQLTKTLARVFQALRIEVNRELDNLRAALRDAPSLLRTGGRMVVISYHSLEDRLVKDAFASAARSSVRPAHPLLPDIPVKPTLKVLTRKPVVPSAAEIASNGRARSAKLRAAEKL